MNTLIDLIPTDPARFILFGLWCFGGFALGYWVLARMIAGWHVAFQVAAMALAVLVPLATRDAMPALFFWQACFGLAAHRGREWHHLLMYRR